MGAMCIKGADGVEEMSSADGSPRSDSGVSGGYVSRRTSLQPSPGNTRDKYVNESEEDRNLRLRVFSACMSGKVQMVQDIVQETGEYCLELRSTSMLDDAQVEPLLANMSRYRRPRDALVQNADAAAYTGQGMAIAAPHPPSAKEVMERAMQGDKTRSSRRPLASTDSPTHAGNEPPQPPPLPGFRSAFQQEALEVSIALARSGPIPHVPDLGLQQDVARMSDENEMSLATPNELIAAAAESAQPEVTSAPNSNGSPLITAASKGARELISYLLLQDQDINEVVHRTTALIAAVRNAQSPEFVKFIVSRGAKAHLGRGQLDRQALHFAVEVGNPTVVRILLEERAVVNWLSRDGYTPLHLAVRKGFTDIVKILVERGADPSIRETLSGMDAFETSAMLKYNDIVTFLQHQKRRHPTQYGHTTVHNPNSGHINGSKESDMMRKARIAAAVRPQLIKEYADSTTVNAAKSLLTDNTAKLNPALSRSVALQGVPANPAAQQLHLDRSSVRKQNPNTIAKSLAASQENPPPAGAAGPPSALSGSVSISIRFDGEAGVIDFVPINGEVTKGSATDCSDTPTNADRSAKALFNQHGWSEKSFHTNMSRARPRVATVTDAPN